MEFIEITLLIVLFFVVIYSIGYFADRYRREVLEE